MDLHVVLVEPEIPHNTGAIGRLCVGLDAKLHLIEPLGFRLDDAYLRRCGLDYWPHLELAVHRSWEAFLASRAAGGTVPVQHGATRTLYECRFRAGAWLVFGSETRGFPPEFYDAYRDRLCRIPMPGAHARSINLANAVSIAALRGLSSARSLSPEDGQQLTAEREDGSSPRVGAGERQRPADRACLPCSPRSRSLAGSARRRRGGPVRSAASSPAEPAVRPGLLAGVRHARQLALQIILQAVQLREIHRGMLVPGGAPRPGTGRRGAACRAKPGRKCAAAALPR